MNMYAHIDGFSYTIGIYAELAEDFEIGGLELSK